MNNATVQHRPLILMILDGWGHSEEQKDNVIAMAKTPNFDQLWQHYPHALLSASGLDVGLPPGQMGNSEVGHLHIGAGRSVLQDLTKIDLVIQTGEFFKNPVLMQTVDETIQAQGAVHIFGLLSKGGVHSRDVHLEAMVELAVKRGCKKVYVHAFLDGRDTPPKSALVSIQSMESKLQLLGTGKIASICGRYYAMDRDKRWDRVQVAYDMLTQGKAEFFAKNAEEALAIAYARSENDEFVKPTCIKQEDETPITIKDGDSVIFMNFRADRGRELSYAFTDPQFSGFVRQAQPKLTAYVTLTEYAGDLKVRVAYPPQDLTNVFGEVLEKNHLRQLRIAETEKYAHVTYFLNGGREEPFVGEDRILIPSPKVATYDLQPEMNAGEVTKRLLEVIRAGTYDVIICNYANPDMVGHTGNIPAAIEAVEFVDDCLGQVAATLREVGGEMVVIADHGNAEKMVDEDTQQAHTAHTINPVPFIYVGRKAEMTKKLGKLIDLAPTMLSLIGIDVPKEMTGECLLNLNEGMTKSA
ncbi:MAG: phosphoglycerate mutase (2,3-diphosphoglycerate-independent) [Gammaproteobacteria bacterium GWE2_37_16]|nr:MAG: phosphoglycerate mutase (2,3-diphosphoglycerate-independent) [Gammaproteobacteria bacterium GWE2_37_16]